MLCTAGAGGMSMKLRIVQRNRRCYAPQVQAVCRVGKSFCGAMRPTPAVKRNREGFDPLPKLLLTISITLLKRPLNRRGAYVFAEGKGSMSRRLRVV